MFLCEPLHVLREHVHLDVHRVPRHQLAHRGPAESVRNDADGEGRRAYADDGERNALYRYRSFRDDISGDTWQDGEREDMAGAFLQDFFHCSDAVDVALYDMPR